MFTFPPVFVAARVRPEKQWFRGSFWARFEHEGPSEI